jgi:hypothetical protein
MGIIVLDRGCSLIVLVSSMEKDLQMDVAGMAAQACQFLCVEEGEGRTILITYKKYLCQGTQFLF